LLSPPLQAELIASLFTVASLMNDDESNDKVESADVRNDDDDEDACREHRAAATAVLMAERSNRCDDISRSMPLVYLQKLRFPTLATGVSPTDMIGIC